VRPYARLKTHERRAKTLALEFPPCPRGVDEPEPAILVHGVLRGRR
jgi:hypothetical protein